MEKINNYFIKLESSSFIQKKIKERAALLIALSIITTGISLYFLSSGITSLDACLAVNILSLSIITSSFLVIKKIKKMSKKKPKKSPLPLEDSSLAQLHSGDKPVVSSIHPSAHPSASPAIIDEDEPISSSWSHFVFTPVTDPDLSEEDIAPSTDEDFAQLFSPRDLEGTPKGYNSVEELRFLQFRLQEQGTPGVDLSGSSERDREFVRRRIAMVERYILPHAHNKESWQRFRYHWSPILAGEAASEGGGDGLRVSEILKAHEINKDLMVKNLGKQLEVHVIGGGPIGLAGVLLWFQFGARVVLHERLKEGESRKRAQPFSLHAHSYGHLAGLGLSKKRILEAYGVTEQEWRGQLKRMGGDEVGAAYHLMQQPLMRGARERRIGPHCADFLPSQTSLPIGLMQELLEGVIKKILKNNSEEIQLIFDHECIGSAIDERRGRAVLEFNKKERFAAPDVIYNCAGGRINEILQIKKIQVAKMRGMGAFFPMPETPLPSAPRPPILSRCVRLFTTGRSNWVYGNFELSEREAGDKRATEKILDIFSRQSGISRTRNYFVVDVDLSSVESAVIVKGSEPSFRGGCQLIINGGDAAIKPDFRTASGANVGLMGQAYLKRLIKTLIREGDVTAFAENYQEFHQVLRKQICQIVVDLFGRPLKIPKPSPKR